MGDRRIMKLSKDSQKVSWSLSGCVCSRDMTVSGRFPWERQFANNLRVCLWEDWSVSTPWNQWQCEFLSFNNSYHFFDVWRYTYLVSSNSPSPFRAKNQFTSSPGIQKESTEDILVSFRTGHFEKGTLVTDSRKIAWHYLQRWFLFDISAPGSHLEFGISQNDWPTHQTRDKDAMFFIVLLLFLGGGSASLSLDASGYTLFWGQKSGKSERLNSTSPACKMQYVENLHVVSASLWNPLQSPLQFLHLWVWRGLRA